jgi:hypothetical protein
MLAKHQNLRPPAYLRVAQFHPVSHTLLANQVVEQGGDYFWVVKDNQPTLRAEIALLSAEPLW